MFFKILEYLKLLTKFDSDFFYFIIIIIISSIFIVIKNMFIILLFKNSELNIINYLIILFVFIIENYLSFKKDHIKLKSIEKYSQQQIIDFNNILNNADLNILQKYSKKALDFSPGMNLNVYVKHYF